MVAASSHAEAKETGECYWIRDYIAPVVDFPQKGVMFEWYVNLLKKPKAFHDAIVGLDSRGFIFDAALFIFFWLVNQVNSLVKLKELITC